MMTERLHNTRVAYSKGVKAQRGRGPNRDKCPYGWSKRELESWWNAGWFDSAKGQVDQTFYMSND
jgi:ribosome modulation factor